MFLLKIRVVGLADFLISKSRCLIFRYFLSGQFGAVWGRGGAGGSGLAKGGTEFGRVLGRLGSVCT